MCHLMISAKGAQLMIGKSSTTTGYRTPTSGKVKIVPYVIYEQAVPGKKLAESAIFRYQETRYIISELMWGGCI